MYDSKQIGNAGEDRAVRYLQNRGYRVIARQWHSRWGEIDIVTYQPTTRTLVCVEVKVRPRYRPGDEPISWRQRRRLARTITAYVQARHHTGAIRCDLLVLAGRRLWHYYNISLD